MHEMAIAAELMRQLEELADRHALASIDAVELRAGALRGIVPEALRAAFAALSEGTRAARAELHLDFVPVRARCRACGAAFAPPANDFLCPECGQADAAIEAGDEILLASLSGEPEQGD